MTESRSTRPISPSSPTQARGGLEEDPDLPTLLAHAVVRLADATGCERVTVWARSSDGRPTVVAASLEGPGSLSPSEASLEALETLERAADLGGPGMAPALAELARRDGLSAAAPLASGSYGPVAFLLAGGSRDPLGRVRPRTLAALESAARRLCVPVAAALSAERLARLDGEVRRLDRLATLGALTAEIAHEIRNPLVSLKTFVDLLPERQDDPEFRKSFFELAQKELRRVERLLDGVLAQARPTREGAAVCAEPDAAVRSVARLLERRAAQSEVELALELPDGLPEVALEEDALHQVILNLLQNAIEASPAGGCVHVLAARDDGIVVLEVRDDGPGVAPELRERIFEPFVTTRSNGSGGLGLAISQRIVREAGGRIALLDADRGTTFRVELPVAPGDAARPRR